MYACIPTCVCVYVRLAFIHSCVCACIHVRICTADSVAQRWYNVGPRSGFSCVDGAVPWQKVRRGAPSRTARRATAVSARLSGTVTPATGTPSTIMSPVLYGLGRTRPPAGSDDAQTGHESAASLEWWRIAAGGRACDIRSKACALNSRSMGEAVVASAATHCAHSSLSQMPAGRWSALRSVKRAYASLWASDGQAGPRGYTAQEEERTTAGHACAT